MWCWSRKSARCSNRTIPEPSACFICCMPVSGNVHTQCKRQLLPWRIYNLNKQASQTLRGRKCYCIFYILLYILGKREGRSRSKLLQSIHWSCWIRTRLPLQRNPLIESGVEPDPMSVSETLSSCPKIVPEPISPHLLILTWLPLAPWSESLLYRPSIHSSQPSQPVQSPRGDLWSSYNSVLCLFFPLYL